MDGEKPWYDEDRLYSGHDSDDSPVLSNRYDKYVARRYTAYATPRMEEREKRSTLTVLAKFFLFSSAMILLCVLMYIPVYNKANDQMSKGLVAGWSIHTNRDTKIYVQPYNLTTIYEPKDVCRKHEKNKLFLLIVVCSATTHFDHRTAIRETWGNYKTYKELSRLYHKVKQRYSNYNYTYDLYNKESVNNMYNNVNSTSRSKRHLSSFRNLLPELAKVLEKNLDKSKTEEVPEKRFEDDNDNEMLPEFDMNEELGQNTDQNYDYYDTNVMKIPPNGYEETPDLAKVLSLLKGDKNFPKIRESLDDSNTDVDFKVVFLLGLPSNDNDSSIQNKIVEESDKYGDVIQEGFVDSYNNLTLKSIMMLKWITNNCNDSVRYILKTDDDMYINVPNLIDNLRNRSAEFDAKPFSNNAKEYLLIGDLICGARPVLDSSNKWYSPRYMYGGRVYPKYLSGTGYALSMPTAEALYQAALTTHYFHLEDIFITGMCAGRARPRLVPRDDPQFSYAATGDACAVTARATAHRVLPPRMRTLHALLAKENFLDTCERMRLTKVRKDRLKPKTTKKHKT